MRIFTAFSKLKDYAPKLQLVWCLNANRISSVMCWDAVEEPSPAGMRGCSGPSGLVPGCLAACPQQLAGSRVCAMGAPVLTSVGGGKVYKQVMNIRVSGLLILFRFLEMDTSPIQATLCWLYELGVLC